MKGKGARAATVDEYLDYVPPALRREFEKLRRAIRSAAPDTDEVISYGMPAIRGSRVLLYYGAFRDHLSLFPGSAETRRRFAEELKPWAGGKGTIRFTPDHPLPLALVKRIVKWRVSEDRGRAPPRAPGSSHKS